MLLTDDLLLVLGTHNVESQMEPARDDIQSATTTTCDDQQTPDKLSENREKLVSSEIRSESSFTNTNNAESQMSPARNDIQSVTTNTCDNQQTDDILSKD
jgi:hypothetical protein